MPVNIHQLRRGFVYSATMLLVAVLAFYSYYRWKLHAASQALPGHLSSEIQRSTHGFSFSKSANGRTLFTIHAAQAVEYKKGGRAELHDVNIIVYGKTSNRFDQIYGSDFEYDPGSGNVSAHGDVHIDLEANAEGPSRPDQAPPQELKNLVHVKTSGLVFNQKTGIASTGEKVEFRLSQATGTAVGATLDSKSSVLELRSNVVVNTPGPESSKITARHALVTKQPRQAVLQEVRIEKVGRVFESSRMIVFMRPDNAIERILASGNVRAEGATPGHDVYEVRAPEGEFLLGEHTKLQHISLRGGVTLDSLGTRPLHGSSENALIDFGASQRLARIHATGNVKLLSSPGKVPAKRAGGNQNAVLQADGVDLFAGRNGMVERAITLGAAQIELQPTTQKAAGGAGKTVVTAGTFTVLFDKQGHTKSVHGEPDAKIVSVSSIPGQPQRVSTSHSLDALFDKSAAIKTLVQRGKVHSSDGQREAFAESAVYSADDQWLTLVGAPRYLDAGMTTTADNLRFHRATGDAFAEGHVKTTYFQNQPAGASQPSSDANSGDPTHVISEKMAATKSTGVARYSGKARLWQGPNIISAPIIDFQRQRRTMVALGSPSAPVKSGFMQTTSQGKPAPVNVTSAKLTYVDDLHTAHFDGHVIMRSSDGVLTANHLDLFLQVKNTAQATPQMMGGGRIDRAVAEGGVLLQQPGRKAEGEKLVYTANDDKFVLTGVAARLPSLFDAVHGVVKGDTLTFYNRDDTVLVESATSARSITQTRVKQQ